MEYEERMAFEAWIRSLPDPTGALEAVLEDWDELHQQYGWREGVSGAVNSALTGWLARAKLETKL